MILRIRHLTQVVSGTVLLMLAGTTTAFAGPVNPGGPPPIEPQFQAPGGSTVADTGDGFPWVYSIAGVVLAIVMAGLIAVLLHRAHAHAPDRGLVTH